MYLTIMHQTFDGNSITMWLYISMLNVFQFSSEEKKRKMVSDMEEHLSELRKEVERLKQNVDPAADAKYIIYICTVTVFPSVL